MIDKMVDPQVMIVGNPVAGFKVYGAYPQADPDGSAYARQRHIENVGGDWWEAPLRPMSDLTPVDPDPEPQEAAEVVTVDPTAAQAAYSQSAYPQSVGTSDSGPCGEPNAADLTVCGACGAERPGAQGTPAGRCGSTKSGQHVEADDNVCEACGERYERN